MSLYAFPPIKFPSGVGVAPAALFVTLLIAAVVLIALPAAVVDERTGLATGGTEHPALVVGLSLALVAMWAYVALRRLIVTPIRLLRVDLESAVAGAGPEIRTSMNREVDRIADTVRGDFPEGRRRTVTSAAIFCLVGAVITSWVVLTPFAVSEGHVSEPALAGGAQEATDGAAAVVRHELESALSGLDAVAVGSTALTDPASTAARAVLTRPLFKGAYVLDADARTLASAGDGTATLTAVPRPGLSLLNSGGAEPHLVATSTLSDGRALVGQFDIRALNDHLRTPSSAITVVDTEMRTILKSSGYTAFEPLQGDDLRQAARRALDGAPTTSALPTRAPTVVTAAPIGYGDASATLRLVAVGAHDPSTALYASNPVKRTSAVVAGIAGVLALVLLTWTYISAIRPLRSLADHARAIAAVPAGGPTPTPVPPERLNETGAIAAALNHILARVLVWRAKADGEATSTDDETRVVSDPESFLAPTVVLRVTQRPTGPGSADELTRADTLLLERGPLMTVGR
ncbi:HAMP domain-containing protein [Actinomycetospora straminea]|nr:HAMP domain-containing protein [Actinomycetospora straminea]MDD7931373.1 HAMP domain-containing protein [Actinomycetospora straminea]